MYNVSEAYKTAVKASERQWKSRVRIITAFETFNLIETDLELNSIKHSEAVMSSDAFSVGGGIMSELSLSIINNGQYDDTQFNGATVQPEIGLEVSSGVYYYVPLGVFTVDDVGRPGATVSLKAFDNLIRADKPFSNVSVGYPVTLKNLLIAVCTHCGVPLATTSFYNDDYSVPAAPEGDPSCRDIITWVAQLACSWARCDRQGLLGLVPIVNPGYVSEADVDGNTGSADGGDYDWYNNRAIDGGVFVPAVIDLTADPTTRYDFNVDDDPIVITGVMYESDDTVYLAGTERYAVDLSDNALIQSGIPDLLNSLRSKLEGYTYLPFTASWIGDPAVQAGDLIEHTDRKGNTYRTIIPVTQYAYRGKSTMSAGGVSESGSKYKHQGEKKLSAIRQKITEKQVAIDALDQAITTATSVLLAGALGGYVIQGEGEYAGNTFIADNPDLAAAVKVWRYNLGGIGHSSTGVGGPYTTAITSDGSIVASIVTADAIRTGLLQSLNGKSWINLDTGAFSLGDGALKWDAVNGFKAISAQRVRTTPTGPYGKIGSITVDNGMGGERTLNGVSIYSGADALLAGLYASANELSLAVGAEDPFLTATDDTIKMGFPGLYNPVALYVDRENTELSYNNGDSESNYSLRIDETGFHFLDFESEVGYTGNVTVGGHTLYFYRGICTNIT